MELAFSRPPRSRILVVALRLLTLTLLLGVVGLGLTQTALLPAVWRLPNPPPLTNAGTTRDDRWRADLDYFASQTTRLHANAFSQVSRQEFNQSVQRLRERIPTMQDYEIVVEMMRLVAMFGDGHTKIFGYQSVGFHTFPIQLEWFGRNLYVVNATVDYSDLIGMRVERINNHTVQSAYKAVTPLISHYNEYGLRRIGSRYLTTPEILKAVGILPEGGLAEYELVDAQGEHHLIHLQPINGGSHFLNLEQINPALNAMPIYLQHRDQNYWFEYLADSQTIYFQYNSAYEMPDLPFEEFTRRLFALADARPVDRLIVDLRFNEGGYPTIFKSFIDGLRTRPALREPDHLFAIIGNETFSAGVWHSVALHDLGAILIGEPTSGRPNGFGQVRRLYLPYSGIGVQYSTRYWRLIEDADPVAVMPDIYAEPTIQDYLAGQDVALSAALSLPGHASQSALTSDQ